MEIRELAKDKLLTTLFLQALKIYQGRDHRDPSSYFQAAAGIHGLPYEPFNGVNNQDFEWNLFNGQKQLRFGGYCHHSTQLFPSWHRPYMMMVEKVCTYLHGLYLLHPPHA
jgi:tyrosinase